MKRAPIVLAVVAVVATIAAVTFGVLYAQKSTTETSTTSAPCGELLFGHIDSLEPDGDHYVLRFDPALVTSGETANVAAAEDGVIEPGDAMPNDNYEVDEGHRLFTYIVPADTPVRVLTNLSPGEMTSPISVSELAQLVAGETPVKLFEPLSTGFRIRVHVDTVCDVEHAYKP
jgi:hypothetical protein